jgi:hypothetical protein
MDAVDPSFTAEIEIDQYDDVNFDLLVERLKLGDFYPCCRHRLAGEIRVALRMQSVIFINIDRVLATLITRGDVVPVCWQHPRDHGVTRTSYFPHGSNPTVLTGD